MTPSTGSSGLALSDKAIGEIVNLGSNFESSIKDLAFKIKEISGSESEIQFTPYDQTRRNGRYEDLSYRAPDLEKIRSLVGYDPKVDLEEALARIVEDYKRSAGPGVAPAYLIPIPFSNRGVTSHCSSPPPPLNCDQSPISSSIRARPAVGSRTAAPHSISIHSSIPGLWPTAMTQPAPGPNSATTELRTWGPEW